MSIELEATTKKNVQIKKNVQPKHGKVGEYAGHTHGMEDEVSTWEEDCVFVEHLVRIPLKVNGEPYHGKVVVPRCFANYLGWMENSRQINEDNIFRSKKLEKTVASY